MRRMFLLLCILPAGCIPGPRVRISPSEFTGLNAVILERRDRDPSTGSMIDGIVFFTPRPVRYVRRLSGDHVIALGAGGTVVPPVDQAAAEQYARMIEREHLRDRQAGEGIRVFCPAARQCFIFRSVDREGHVVLEIRDQLQPHDAAPSLKNVPLE